MSIYDCKFIYIKGPDNTVADALSQYPSTNVGNTVLAESNAQHPYNTNETKKHMILNLPKEKHTIHATSAALSGNIHEPEMVKLKSTISINDSFVERCCTGYGTDKWCQKLLSTSRGMPELTIKDGLWFIGERMIIPGHSGLREEILKLAHDTLGHFGFYKSYENIRQSYFWPGMRKDLEEGYIPSCRECMRNKSFTTKPTGPLHSLPVPDDRCASISLDFIGPLPLDEGYDCILTITDQLGSDI